MRFSVFPFNKAVEDISIIKGRRVTGCFMGGMLSTLRPTNMSQGPGGGAPEPKKVRIQAPIREDNDEEFDEKNTQDDIEFVERLARGETLAHIGKDFPHVDHQRLLSALHWVGLELNERVNLHLELTALDAAEAFLRQNIEKLEDEQGHLLFMEEAMLSSVVKADSKIIPIQAAGPTKVTASINRVELECLVPGGLVQYDRKLIGSGK